RAVHTSTGSADIRRGRNPDSAGRAPRLWRQPRASRTARYSRPGDLARARSSALVRAPLPRADDRSLRALAFLQPGLWVRGSAESGGGEDSDPASRPFAERAHSVVSSAGAPFAGGFPASGACGRAGRRRSDIHITGLEPDFLLLPGAEDH